MKRVYKKSEEEKEEKEEEEEEKKCTYTTIKSLGEAGEVREESVIVEVTIGKVDYTSPPRNPDPSIHPSFTAYHKDSMEFTISRSLAPPQKPSLHLLSKPKGDPKKQKPKSKEKALEILGVQDLEQLQRLFQTPNEELQRLGLGGIGKQFQELLEKVIVPRCFTQLSADSENGILLIGPPGTGKSLLASKLGELLGCDGKDFVVIEGSTIKDMWFGNTEQKIRELFKKAESAYPRFYIIVFDEIDAWLGCRDQGASARTSQTDNSVVGTFLSCMDGAGKRPRNLLVVGTTNQPDNIDPAAKRKGRFGLHLTIGIPNEQGREEILRIHTEGKDRDLERDVNLKELAKGTEDYSGADLGELAKSAQRKAAMRGLRARFGEEEPFASSEKCPPITMQDFQDAREEISASRDSSASLSEEKKSSPLRMNLVVI